MVRRARRVGGPPENDIWNALFYALLGSIVGARLGYVLGHLSQVTDGGDDPLGVFRVWEGGISLIGGITGAVLMALPYVLRKRMGFWRTMDLAAPGLALGIVIGRVGDLIIGDHLGKPTTFALGWRCLGSEGDPPVAAEPYLRALEAGDPPSLGCFDLVLHQTALYDFISTLLLLGVLLWLGKQQHNAGFMILLFTVWYGAVRVITDSLRVDRRYFDLLTGSQLMTLAAGLVCLYLLARYRGAPPGLGAPPTSSPPLEPSAMPPLVPPAPGHEGADEAPETPMRPEESRAPATKSDEDPGSGDG
jgi:phosphatidylglycerol---prolipoprotein diacylglyceryl transferase